MNEMASKQFSDPFAAKLTIGFVGRGKISSVEVFVDALTRAAKDTGVDVIFVTTSGSRLWIKEGDGP